MYQAPTNDPRLLSLTPRELSEEVSLGMAFTKYLETRPEQRASENDDTVWARHGKIISGEEGKKIADTPILTGDPDYDRWELEETQGEALPAHFFEGSDARAKTHDDP